MERVAVYEAKSRLSELIQKVESGEEVTITRHGKPVVKLVRAGRGKRIDRSALVDEIIAFSKTCKAGRLDLRKLIAEGRD